MQQSTCHHRKLEAKIFGDMALNVCTCCRVIQSSMEDLVLSVSRDLLWACDLCNEAALCREGVILGLSDLPLLELLCIGRPACQEWFKDVAVIGNATNTILFLCCRSLCLACCRQGSTVCNSIKSLSWLRVCRKCNHMQSLSEFLMIKSVKVLKWSLIQYLN